MQLSRPLLASLALVVSVLAALAPGADAAPRDSAARVTVCASGLAASERALVVEGQMRTREGAARLQMRFTLQSRAAGESKWGAIAGEGLDTWRTASPAPARFVYAKRVDGLVAPARYRMVVAFKWVDAQGKRMGSARRVSRVCVQRDPRPNLRITRLQVLEGSTAATRRYVVTIRNAGRGAAGPFATGLTVGSQGLAPVATAGLAPRATTQLSWVGPACAAATAVLARVDLDGTVDESDEADDELAATCPVARPEQG